MCSQGQSVFDVGLPVQTAIYQESKPSDGFGMDVKVPCDATPLKFPLLDFLPVWGPRLTAGKDPCYFRFVLVHLEPVPQEGFLDLIQKAG